MAIRPLPIGVMPLFFLIVTCTAWTRPLRIHTEGVGEPCQTAGAR
jgi:hypothetical protein